MSSDVNSTLPDSDALAAFANAALGGGRRRRRQQAGGDGEGSAVGTAPSPTSEQAQDSAETSAPAVTAEPAPEPEPEAASEPATKPEPEAASEPAPEPEPEAATEPAPEPEPPATPRAAPTEPKQASEPVGEGEATVPRPAPAPESTAATASNEPRPEPRTPAAEVEVRAVPVPVARTSPLPAGLQNGAVIEVQVPDLGPAGARSTQCTVMVSQNIRDRFAHYQLQKKIQGQKEPSNALVIRRAFLHARRNNLFGKILADVYHRANAVDEEDYDEDGLLGEVIGRRTVRGRLRDSGQQSFRPSQQELATYDAFATAYGFPDRSAFMEGLLDEFLPQLPTSGRRR